MGHFFSIRIFSPSISKCKKGIESITYISQKSSMGNKQWMYSIPILREEKCTKDFHVLLPSHTITIQHWPYLYYYHSLFITYYSNILSNPVFVHQIFSASCTKYKFIVAVISPFFIWMTIFERSMKKVPCVLELLSHGLIYPA